ncbi:MAG: choice-of-anchor tandem repeat GloVer-containing protein [Candidatus Korobacteraceae bacterium]
MTHTRQNRNGNGAFDLWATIAAYALALLMIVFATSLHAQTFTVLHAFAPQGRDGYEPLAGLAMDRAGNLYGTTAFGGHSNQCSNCGTVFQLVRRSSGWTYSTILSFNGVDGEIPVAQLIVGQNGTLYGTCTAGGSSGEYGTVFNLQPQPRVCATVLCPWIATVLHNFYYTDGYYATNITFDQAGNLYGTTMQGGSNSAGVVYELTPSGGSWTFQILTDFAGSDIGDPNGVVPDHNGNLYGTAYGGYPGVVFELTNSGQLQILHQFSFSTGIDPDTGLMFDSSGNLYGQTLFDGPSGGGGTVFELSPSAGGWTFNTLYSFPGGINNGTEGNPNLTMDSQGNLYGTTFANGAYDQGIVFKLTPSANGWIYTDLHDFTGGDDGCGAWSNVAMDSQGNLYGTSSSCGANGGGTVWEITP